LSYGGGQEKLYSKRNRHYEYILSGKYLFDDDEIKLSAANHTNFRELVLKIRANS